ncbi:MAG TPA: hypothetical protein VGE01_09475 [Fimbriimonas sp.]
MEDRYLVDIQTDSSEAAQLKGVAGVEVRKESPVQAPPVDPVAGSRFVEPVSLIAAVTISVIAKRLVETWLKSKEEGVLIDLSKDPVVISRIAGVPAGFIVKVDKDGKAETIQADYKDTENLSSLLAKVVAPAKV